MILTSFTFSDRKHIHLAKWDNKLSSVMHIIMINIKNSSQLHTHKQKFFSYTGSKDYVVEAETSNGGLKFI